MCSSVHSTTGSYISSKGTTLTSTERFELSGHHLHITEAHTRVHTHTYVVEKSIVASVILAYTASQSSAPFVIHLMGSYEAGKRLASSREMWPR